MARPSNVTSITSGGQGSPTSATPGTPGTPGNPNDPWSLTSATFSSENFYTRATDGNGHDAVMSVKVSPALIGEIQRLVQSRVIPQYRTHSDVIRDALIHRLRYLNDEYPGSTNLAALEIEQRQAELDRLATERAAWRKLLADLEAQLNELIGDGELEEAEWLIEQNDYLEAMTPPFLLKLNKVLKRARQRIADAHKEK